MTHIIINKIPSLDVSIMGPKHEINWYYSTRNSPRLNQTVILNNMSVIYPLSSFISLKHCSIKGDGRNNTDV